MADLLDVTGWAPRAWDSAFFGVSIAQVTRKRPTIDQLAEAVGHADRASIDCLYFLADPAEPTSIRAAEATGFSLVDIRLTLDCRMDRSSRGLKPTYDEGMLEATRGEDLIRPARPADIPRLKELARVSHRNTRFYLDSHFDRDRCDELYGVWIERSANGELADAVWVVDVGGVANGYLTVKAAPDQAVIGLVAVDEACRGRGYGGALLESVLTWAAARELPCVSVITQGASVPAARLYQRAGFRQSAIGLWYHRWRCRDAGGD
jgi:dTDP-4-amino-4,6-dideoxy-D-galactose acyltransferase